MASTAWKYYKDLKAGGVPEAQAVAETDALDIAIHGLEAKIDQIKEELKTEIQSVKKELKVEINEVRKEVKEVKQDLRSSTSKIFYTVLGAIALFIIKTVINYWEH